jgi:predicted transcriptional regulator
MSDHTFPTAVQRVRAFVKASNLGRYAIAKRAGLSASALQRIDDPTWRPRCDTIEKLEKFMAENTASPQPEPEASAA